MLMSRRLKVLLRAAQKGIPGTCQTMPNGYLPMWTPLICPAVLVRTVQISGHFV